MIRKILPIALGLFGLCLGAGAGYILRPMPINHASASGLEPNSDVPTLKDYAKLANPFIVPVMAMGKVSALMVLSLSLEVRAGMTSDVNTAEPKLRDVFLQVLFDHANAGGFSGSYTDAANLVALRTALLEAAKSVLGEKVTDVLITDILRREG